MGTSAERFTGYFSASASNRAESCGEKTPMVSALINSSSNKKRRHPERSGAESKDLRLLFELLSCHQLRTWRYARPFNGLVTGHDFSRAEKAANKSFGL